MVTGLWRKTCAFSRSLHTAWELFYSSFFCFFFEPLLLRLLCPSGCQSRLGITVWTFLVFSKVPSMLLLLPRVAKTARGQGTYSECHWMLRPSSWRKDVFLEVLAVSVPFQEVKGLKPHYIVWPLHSQTKPFPVWPQQQVNRYLAEHESCASWTRHFELEIDFGAQKYHSV